MINDEDDIIYTHSPVNRISVFDYLWLFVNFIKAAITSKRSIAVNLPCEIQYPYLYFHWENGTRFINFAERLKHFFHLKLYWTNCLPKEINSVAKGEDPSRLTVSWDFIPKNINLLINSKIIKRGGEKAKQFLQLREGGVRFV